MQESKQEVIKYYPLLKNMTASAPDVSIHIKLRDGCKFGLET